MVPCPSTTLSRRVCYASTEWRTGIRVNTSVWRGTGLGLRSPASVYLSKVRCEGRVGNEETQCSDDVIIM